MQVIRKYILACIVVVLIKLYEIVGNSISSSIYPKYTSERFIGNVAFMLTTRSALACCISCLNRQDFTCAGVNYEDGDRLCELFEDSASTVTGQIGWTRISVRDAECESGWMEFDTKCFKAFYNGRTWDSALNECQSLGGSLASLQTQAMFDFLTYELRTGVSFTRFWIGARDYAEDNNVYHWMDGSEVTGYDPWYPGEPNGASEACVELKNMNGVYNFNDHQCSRVYYYVCEKSLS